MSKDEAGDPGVGMVLEDEETADSAPLAGRFGSLRAANQDRYADRHGADVVAHSGAVAWQQAGPSQENHARRETMTALHLHHVRPGTTP